MARRSYLFITLFVVLFSVAATAMSPTTAQENGELPPDHPLIGTWRVTVSEGDLQFPAVFTFSADGTYSDITPNVSAIAPDFVVFSTPSLGVWEATGETSGAATSQYFFSDGEGNLSTIGTLSHESEVSDDGQAVSGAFAYSVAAPDGTVVHASGGTFDGTRLAVVPMDSLATPAASPEA